MNSPSYDSLVDAAVTALLLSCRSQGPEADAALAETTKLTVEALRVRTGLVDAFPRADVAAVDRDVKDRLEARLLQAARNGAAALAGIEDPRIMEKAIGKLLFSDAARLA
jgi:hypothetical protein